MTVYTFGVWTVQPGREDDFVRAWLQMGARTIEEFPEARGTLLRDRDWPERFISFGPWESTQVVEAWRQSDAFTEGFAAIRQVLQDFEPHTMEHVATVR